MKANYYIMLSLIDQLIISNHKAHACLTSAAQAVTDISLRLELQAYAKSHQVLELELTHMASQLNLSTIQYQMNAIIPGRSSLQHALVTKSRYVILVECQAHLNQALACYEEIMRECGALQINTM